ncbi:MAG: PD40 domain-containing protein, partial [Bryobacterales bacterium]|nr:PD40 domain-containing protein [Bryobacterales bacterium]
MRLFLFALTLCAIPSAYPQTKLLRFPDIHQNKVVFTYGGDLWTASSEGGTATRLTAHPGLELFAKFSPDGQWIAFTGQYDGDEQVYVIPATGGAPKQLTWYPARGPLPDRWGYDNQVYGWTPDSKAVLFRSMRDAWTTGQNRLFTVPVTGGLPVELPMPQTGAGDLSPDGTKIVYSPLFRDFRSWKRYQGGWAQDLYIFDTKTSAIEPVAHHPRTDRDPMWLGNRIYFNSDRSGKLNLYEFDPASKKVRAVTEFTDWDVRWPSRGDKDEIIFEQNGELHVISTKPGSKARRIRINVPDDGLASRPGLMQVGGQVSNFDLSPKGERALFTARGDIFTAPIEKGVSRNLTRSSNAHDKAPAWSPDGSRIAFLSDRSGEEEIWMVNQDGSGGLQQLTTNGKAMRYNVQWSPDGKMLSFSDKDGKLYLLKLSDKSITEIADDTQGQMFDAVWAPDSGYLAYSLANPNQGRSLWIYSIADGKAQRVTDPSFNATGPSFDPEGKYLYYLSNREYAPMIGTTEFNFALTRSVALYAMALRKDVANPFPPESDEVTIEKKDEKKEEKKDEKKPDSKEPKPLNIDFDGISGRVARVPLPPANYNAVVALKGHLLYSKSGSFFYGREPEAQPSLVIYSLKDRKEAVLADNIQGWATSFDGSKVLVRQAGAFQLMPLTMTGATAKKAVSTAGLTVDRVPSQEYTQIFNEVWRRFRDFFYVSNMHGYDWEALRRQYSPQLEYVAHRSDLNYIIAEMISELNVGHAYIAGGDWNIPARPRVALPGARFALDEASGRYKIAKIFQGHNEEPAYRSPLTEVGVNVTVGDYVLAVDGEDLTATTNPYRLLRGKADRQVRLTVNVNPVMEGSREVVFQPIASEDKLLYLEMVLRNKERVEKATNGRAGYLHIP